MKVQMRMSQVLLNDEAVNLNTQEKSSQQQRAFCDLHQLGNNIA